MSVELDTVNMENSDSVNKVNMSSANIVDSANIVENSDAVYNNSTADELVSVLGKYLTSHETEKAILEIRSEQNQSYLKEKGWDLIPVVCEFLTEDNAKQSKKLLECCEILLNEIALVANPKEAIIGFLEQCEAFEDDVKFLTLLKPIQTLLLKQPGKRGMSLEWTLTTLYAHVNSLPLPETYNLEGDERKLMDMDPVVRRIAEICDALCLFYGPFVKEISLKEKHVHSYPDRVSRQRELMAHFILRLFNHPLTFIDLTHVEGDAKSSVRASVEKLMGYLTNIVSNFMKFLEHLEEKNHNKETVTKKENEITSSRQYGSTDNVQGYEDKEHDHTAETDDDGVSDLSLATFYYLIFAENVELSSVPHVYNPVFIFQSCLHLIITLLNSQKDCAIQKGLLLANALLDRLPQLSLSAKCFDLNEYNEFPISLTSVMVYCEITELRGLAVKILPKYIYNFDMKGRYQLIRNLLNCVQHSGVRGYLITRFKDNLAINLNSDLPSPYFLGKHLAYVVTKVCSLPESVESDLLENSDQIISALNLLRYLVLRDKENITGIWHLLPVLEKDFFTPLHKGLDMARAHFKLRVNELEEGKKLSKLKDLKINVNVGGEKLYGPPSNHEDMMMMAAFNTLDLIQSILVRVSECIDIVKHDVTGIGVSKHRS